MVNEKAVLNFQKYAAKNLKAQLAGPPLVYAGGVEVDHYKGLARTFASSLVPFMSQRYEATEFLYGALTLRDATIPHLFFQIPLLKVKNKNIPTVATFGAYTPVSIPETIVAPTIGFSTTFVPISAVPRGAVSSKAVDKRSATASPMAAALNASRAMRKASKPVSLYAEVGRFRVQINLDNPIGAFQMAPYKGFTILTGQCAPSTYATPDHPTYKLSKICKKFRLIAHFIGQRQARGQEVGQQVISNSNASMMQLIFQQLDSLIVAGAGAPGATTPQPRPA